LSLKPEKNIFILLTPHSYLNACELQFKFRLPEESLYIYFLTEHRESLRQIENMLDSTTREGINQGGIMGGEIRFLFGSKGRRIGRSKISELILVIRNFVYIFFLSIHISKIKRLVIANILNPWMRFLVSRSRAEEIIVLDDGNATIPILQENRNIEEQFRIPSQLKARKNWLMSRLQNSPIMNARLKFFTVFDSWDKDHTLIKIPNDLGYMKQFAGSFKTTSEVLFIGSPLVNFGLISEEVFQRLIAYLKKFFNGLELVYVRHRTEPEEFHGGLKCISFEKPIELYLLENKILPPVVASFFSTAGINLHRIFGNRIQVINMRIPDHLITNPQYANLLKVLSDYYTRQVNDCFRIIDMDII